MSTIDHRQELEDTLRRFEARLPESIARFVRWVRAPSSSFVRVPMGGLLILFGIFGFLPLVGFWMIPLGLILIAQDVPALQRPILRVLAWIEQKLEAREARSGRATVRKDSAKGSAPDQPT